jgi:hypothetical protein
MEDQFQKKQEKSYQLHAEEEDILLKKYVNRS